jgi:hypothetical protein
MTKDEALDLALEALEAWLPTVPNLIEKKKAAITAIKQARSAPVQEPVASVPIHPKTGPLWAMTTDKPDPERLPSYPLMNLYTTPPAAQQDIQRLSALVRAQQITIDKLEQALAAPVTGGWRLVPINPTQEMLDEPPNAYPADALVIWNAMISKVPAAPVQEPVAWIRWEIGSDGKLKQIELPLTAPPAAQRQWVGLTDEEKRQIFEREDYQGWLDYINAIEAELKERNT